MTDPKLLLDFARILRLTEQLISVDDKIDFLLTIKRDAQVLIQKANQSVNRLFGEKVKPELINLPEQIDFEINRLEKLRSLNIKTDKKNNSEKITEAYKTDVNHDIISSDDEFLDVNKAAKYLGVSTSYIYKLTSKKLIRFSKPTGKKVFINKSDLKKFIDDNKGKTKDELEKLSISYLTRKKK